MNRNEFIKKIALLFSSGYIITKTKPELLKAETTSSSFKISDDCTGCEACISESPSELLIMDDEGAYANFKGGTCVQIIDNNPRKGNASGDCAQEIFNLMDVCPVDAIKEVG